MRASRFPRRGRGFTLVELLVVIGIIAVLISILLPTLSRARKSAMKVQCQSNLRQVGAELLAYSQKWKGWIVPPDLGFTVPVDMRWGVQVFKPPVAHPAIMHCPADDNPDGDHSYILNGHFVDHKIRYFTKIPLGISPANMPLAGEKVSWRDDYYLNVDDYYSPTLETERHGRTKGANFLFLDMHVSSDEPPEDLYPGQQDPWDIPS